MNNVNNKQDLILLFDEQGTPTFGNSRETDFFLGIGIIYNNIDEETIFNQCYDLFGLSNTNPLKNQRISNSRANDISRIVENLPIKITICKINLSDREFQDVVNLYGEFGTAMRKIHRQIRGRPISQILHTHILSDTLYISVTLYVKQYTCDSNFSIFIDNWSMPVNDIEIELSKRCQTLQQNTNDLFSKFFNNINISIHPIILLREDSNRKRFVDIITSVISRAFLDKGSERYNIQPLQNILRNTNNVIIDITDNLKNFMRDFMDTSLRVS